MVAAVTGLGDRSAAELTAPDDESILQQAACLQSREECRDRLIHLSAVAGVEPDEFAVRIPADFIARTVLVVDLDEADIALGQTCGPSGIAIRNPSSPAASSP